MKHIEFWVYQLKRDDMVEDWYDPIEPGKLKSTPIVVAQVVVNAPSDTICIGGYGKDGKFYQYDSYEAYHSHAYFEQNFDQHGLYTDCVKVRIPDIAKYIVEE
jgi:hypothetical protein